ncbi:DEAD/DEAH box helicase [Vulgatibacter incomptus]|uniref:ATP-dependent RNA helicase RhlE n=1 Tax=Vulgatibacter incomptus TaxID=1391653 RepID=A0A0K1PAJ0_9BACT|nr:DEAD/DEAH box helicase [Vulgatibacter incomptus]AKU90431.1 ATP-dependent RNA helicase RhlE [Vulgatibacter incomptus]
MTTFASLGLSADMLRALARAGYEKPTPIQSQAIPPALAGRNVIGCAATGTGKTAAFMLPLLERAATHQGGIRALVLAPTRELAQQIHEYVDTFGGVRAALVVGGLGMGPQTAALRKKPELVIATPGRLIDHLDQRNVDLSGVEALVLDEADRMLDMGFRPQLEKILGKMKGRKQTLLFSATIDGEVGKFSAKYVNDPVQVEIHRTGTTAERAEQRIFRVEKTEKSPLLLALLSDDDETTLVFVRTKHRADKIARVVEKAGHKVTRLHGDRTQSQRKMALAGFKDGRYRVLVATDVAARGIDVEEIGHVINFDLPNVAEDYVHRIGRTARNTASGRATSFAEPDDKLELMAIEKLLGRQLPREAVPKDHPVFVAELSQRKERQSDPGIHGGRTHAQLAGERPAHAPRQAQGPRQAQAPSSARRGGGGRPSRPGNPSGRNPSGGSGGRSASSGSPSGRPSAPSAGGKRPAFRGGGSRKR